jgi:hypothetical protein
MGILAGRRAAAHRQLVVLVKPSTDLTVTGAAQALAFGDILAPFGARLQSVVESAPDARVAAAAPESAVHRERLARFHRVLARDGDLEALRDRLAQHPSIEAAYIKAPGEPPVAVLRRSAMPAAVSGTPDFTSRQGYLGPAPVGVDALHAWAIRGGGGAGVKIIDCEWSWNFGHEDLATHCNGAVVGSPAADDFDHGTAVIGSIVGNANGFGITGVAPDAVLSTACFDDSGDAPTSQIIQQGADKLSLGDILLLEIHRPGPNTPDPEQGQLGYIPIEWWPDDFQAILYATSKGILVVEAGGNGSQNLDDPSYSIPQLGFPSTWANPFAAGGPDSGAILVGAGNPPAGTHGRTTDTLGFGETYVDRARCVFSNYGQRVDSQAWGWEVTTLGYGDLQPGAAAGIQPSDQNRLYTDVFAGTSSASPIVTGVLACAQGALRAAGRALFTPQGARQLLRTTGSVQQSAVNRPASQHIGARPDLRAILTAALVPSVAGVPVVAAGLSATRPRTQGRHWVCPAAVFAMSLLTMAVGVRGIVPPWLAQSPLVAWFADLVLVSIFFLGLGVSINQSWAGAAVDWRNKLSLSRLQIVIWTILFAATLLASFSWNASHGASLALVIPNSAWLLMGISGITAVGAPLIVSQKPDVPRGIAPLPPPDMLVEGIIVTRPAGAQLSWLDLVRGDELGNAAAIDVGKVQQLLFTLVAVLSYGVAIAHLFADTTVHGIAELPTMDGGFISLLAASSATYLAYKAVPHT